MSNIERRSGTTASALGLISLTTCQTRPIATTVSDEATVCTVDQERVPVSRHGGDYERVGGLSSVRINQSINCHIDCGT